MVLAATPPPPSRTAPQVPPSAYPSEEAARHYVLGRLLEEGGEGDQALGEYFRALLLDPEAASVARRVSELSGRLGQPERSLEFAERSLALHPGDPHSLWLKGAALLSLGRASDAAAALEAAVRADSTQPDYYRALARAAEPLDRVDLVAFAYRHAVELDPDDGESWFQLGAAEIRLGHFAAADSALTEAAQLEPLRPGILFLQGFAQENLGHADRAIVLYRRHLEAHGQDLVTRRRLVNLLIDGKRYAEAYPEAQKVARAHPEDLEATQVEADLALELGRATEGNRALARIERQAPDDAEAMSRIVTVLSRHGRSRDGAARAEAWAAHHAGDYRAAMLAARARALNREPGPAFRWGRRAVALAPDSLAPRVMLGRLYQEHKRFAQAESVWAEAAARFPTVDLVAFDLAQCREQQGNLVGAEQAVRDVLRREPENAEALNFLGYLFADHNLNLGEAEDLIRRALARDPDNGAYVDSLGWLLYRLGRLEEARRELERAVRLTGGDPVVHEHLGDVYKDLKLFDLARAQYARSLAADSSNTGVREKLREVR